MGIVEDIRNFLTTPALCKWCKKKPRAFASAFCCHMCMVLWRRFDAVQRGYTPSDDYEGDPPLKSLAVA